MHVCFFLNPCKHLYCDSFPKVGPGQIACVHTSLNPSRTTFCESLPPGFPTSPTEKVTHTKSRQNTFQTLEFTNIYLYLNTKKNNRKKDVTHINTTLEKLTGKLTATEREQRTKHCVVKMNPPATLSPRAKDTCYLPGKNIKTTLFESVISWLSYTKQRLLQDISH